MATKPVTRKCGRCEAWTPARDTVLWPTLAGLKWLCPSCDAVQSHIRRIVRATSQKGTQE